MELFKKFLASYDEEAFQRNNKIIGKCLKSKSDRYEFIHDTHLNEKTISQLLKLVESSGLSKMYKNFSLIGRVDKDYNVEATMDSKKWYKIGCLKDEKESLNDYSIFLVSVRNTGTKRSYNSLGYNFYIAMYK